MDGVNKTADFYSSIGLATKTTEKKAASEQDQFLQLMIAQLKNQDPFKPMENGEFLTQIAQFSTVTGIKDLQKSFEGIATSMQSNQALQASSLVGRKVMVPHSVGALTESGLNGAVDLGMDAEHVLVSVRDKAGQLVAKFDLGPRPAGMTNFTWDGRAANGANFPPGTYQVSAEAMNGKTAEAVAAYASSIVESVTIGQGGRGMTLNLTGIGAWNINDIKQVL